MEKLKEKKLITREEKNKLLIKFMWTSYFFAIAVMLTSDSKLKYIAFIPWILYVSVITWRIK